MKITNFNLVKIEGSNVTEYMFFATVDVTTGCFLWKKTTQRTVVKPFAGYWFFLDTGEFTPLSLVESMSRAYAAQNGIKYL